ncbi:unnamed protein product [marine sediment metagenome]|uniref:Uncharacterized protein n=1 Tax=marine sediment metagenome TaxID=412755 RepID=X1ACE3_9ZZZZ
MKIINEIKDEWNKNKVRTGFMGAVVFIAILNFIKPDSTSGLLKYLGLSIINFSLIAIIILLIWYFYWRKKNGII